MKLTHFIVLYLAFLSSTVGSLPEAKLKWIKIHDREAALGRYMRAINGFELYSFYERFCMVTFDPADQDPNDEDVVLGWTDAAEWSLTSRGLIKVTGRFLKIPVYFAFVRCEDLEGMIRLDSASDRPPSRVNPKEFQSMLYHRLKEETNDPLDSTKATTVESQF